jgi:hypothetical protein
MTTATHHLLVRRGPPASHGGVDPLAYLEAVAGLVAERSMEGERALIIRLVA